MRRAGGGAGSSGSAQPKGVSVTEVRLNHQRVGPDAGMIGAGVLALFEPIEAGTPQPPARGARHLLKHSVG